VAQVAAPLGAGAEAVDAAVAAGARGIVVETAAAGGVPPAPGRALARAVEAGVAVVAASRARGTPREDGEVGGHMWLREHGVLAAFGLAPEKARVRLALALGADGEDAVRSAFPAPTPRRAARPVARPAPTPRSTP
jgi:L-asparaginase